MKNYFLIVFLCFSVILFLGSGVGAADWTFMVYIAGDNNLEGAGVADINEMEAIGSTSDVNIVVQFDRSPGYDTTNGNWTDTRRGLISKDYNTETISSTLNSIGEKNMADPATLTEFINWGVSNYPADHYAVILWNHGGGWRSDSSYQEKQLEQFKEYALNAKSDSERKQALSRYLEEKDDFKKPMLLKDVCYDDTSGGDALFTKEVRQALEGVSANMDVIGFDACLMGMVEVAYEIRDEGSVMVGSQNTEPGDGWPYDLIMDDLTGDPGMTPAELGTSIVTNYNLSYAGAETQSAVDLTQLGSLGTALDAFAGAMISSGSEWSSLFQARASAGYFYEPDYRDLIGFMEGMADSASNATVVSTANQALTLLNSLVIANESSPYYDGNGLSVYLTNVGSSPSSYYSSSYIDFAADTRWDEMLIAIAGETIPDDEYEDNDTSAQCATLDFGMHNALSCQDDDWFRVYVPDNGKPTIAVIHDYYSGDLDLEVYDPAGDLIATGLTTSDYETVSFNAAQAGYYCIKVYGFSGDQNYYYNLSIYDAENEPGFSVTRVPYEFESYATATRLEMGDDDFTAVGLGFNFDFYDRLQTTLKISANGYLTFSYLGSQYYNLPFPIPGEPNSIIAPLWDDLVPPVSGGGVYYELDDDIPGEERFIVSWVECGHYTFSGPTDGVTFQAVLNRDGSIQFNYQDVDFENSDYNQGFSATVGCENPMGTKGKLFSYNSTSLENGMSLLLEPEDYTAANSNWTMYK